MSRFAVIVLAAALLGGAARADVTVGAVLSLTGPGASLGIPERNIIDMLPREVAGQKIRYVVLDDATDSTAAVKNFQKLVSEEKADIIIGPSVTPTSLAVLDVAGASGTPFISLAGSESVIVPQEGNRRWAFKLASSEALMLSAPLDAMKAQGIKSLAAIGVSTAFGDAFIAAAKIEAERRGITWLGDERYAPTDTTVTPQALKTMAKQPGAIFLASSGTPGALPVIELKARGFKGLVIHNQGIANPDFLRVAGKSADGMLLSASPVTVAEQLQDGSPVKASALEYVRLYEGKYGPNSRSLFGGTAWDGFLLLTQALPTALKAAQPGTPAFRTALRDAIEQLKDVYGACGVYSMSPTNHNGTDTRALVLVTVENGGWKLLK